jgi:hypothetical protein
MFGFEQHLITKQFAPFSQRSIVSMSLATNERERNPFGLFASHSREGVRRPAFAKKALIPSTLGPVVLLCFHKVKQPG